MAAVFQRTAEVLEHSAELADQHATREELAGRTEIARNERFQAAWARHEAQRARTRAASTVD